MKGREKVKAKREELSKERKKGEVKNEGDGESKG